MTYYNYCYKIINKINGKFYIGIHRTNNLNDGYMGSGVAIINAIKKYGVENFEKIILKYFDSVDEMVLYEHEIVDMDFVKRRDTYNLTLGGGFGYWSIEPTYGKLCVYDDNGDKMQVSTSDPKFLDGSYKAIQHGRVQVFDVDGNIINVSVKDPRYLSGEYVFIGKNRVNVKDKNGNRFSVYNDDVNYLNGEYFGACKGTKKSTFIAIVNGKKERISFDDPRYLSGEIENIRKGKVVAIVNGENILVDVNDPRFKSGEITHINKGKMQVKLKCSDEIITINKKDFDGTKHITLGKGMVTCYDDKGVKHRVSINDPRYLSGELKQNKVVGMVTVRDKNGNTFNVPKDDPRYLSGIYTANVKDTKYINDGVTMRRVPKDYELPDGWKLGMIKRRKEEK